MSTSDFVAGAIQSLRRDFLQRGLDVVHSAVDETAQGGNRTDVYVVRTARGSVSTAFIVVTLSNGNVAKHNYFTTNSIDNSDNFDVFPVPGVPVENVTFGAGKLHVELKAIDDYIGSESLRGCIYNAIHTARHAVITGYSTVLEGLPPGEEKQKVMDKLDATKQEHDADQADYDSSSDLAQAKANVRARLLKGLAQTESELQKVAAKKAEKANSEAEAARKVGDVGAAEAADAEAARWTEPSAASKVRAAKVASSFRTSLDDDAFLALYKQYKKSLLAVCNSPLPPILAKLAFGSKANFFLMKYGWEELALREWCVFYARRYFLARSPELLYLFYALNSNATTVEFSTSDDTWANRPPKIDGVDLTHPIASALQAFESQPFPAAQAFGALVAQNGIKLLGKVNQQVIQSFHDAAYGLPQTIAPEAEALQYLVASGWPAWFDSQFRDEAIGGVLEPNLLPDDRLRDALKGLEMPGGVQAALNALFDAGAVPAAEAPGVPLPLAGVLQAAQQHPHHTINIHIGSPFGPPSASSEPLPLKRALDAAAQADQSSFAKSSF